MKKKVTAPTKKMAADVFIPRPPKQTRQGAGTHSLPRAGKKAYRGQGR